MEGSRKRKIPRIAGAKCNAGKMDIVIPGKMEYTNDRKRFRIMQGGAR